MLENLANLIKVKTIITLLMTAVFCYLAITGVIAAEMFMTIFTMVVSFYFGVQSEKRKHEEITTE